MVKRMTIQLRYTSGTPWNFTPVTIKKKDFNSRIGDMFESACEYVSPDWKTVVAYMMAAAVMLILLNYPLKEINSVIQLRHQ